MGRETLGSVADIVMGQSPPGEAVTADPVGLPLLNGPTEFGTNHPTPVQFTTDVRKKALQGDLLFCVRGSTTGRMNWADREYAIGRGIAAIRHKEDKRVQHFVRAVIEYGLSDLLAQATGSTFPNVSASQLAGIPYPAIDINEQRAIAHILGTLDDKIELNRRMNETLEAIARAVFKSWFVDFDPVRAKASGEAPESICRRLGLTPDLLALFPDRLVDSELGEIPEGWKVRPLPTVIDVNPSRALKKGVVAPYLDMANMPTTSARALSVVERELGSGMKFENGDTLVARITPCLENGKTCFVDFLKDSQIGWGSTEYIVLRPKHTFPNEYAYFLARTDMFRSHAIANMTGTSGRQRVPATAFDRFLLVVPNAELAREFGRFANDVFTKMRANDEESNTQSSIRDALLPKLLSGELDVRTALDIWN